MALTVNGPMAYYNGQVALPLSTGFVGHEADTNYVDDSGSFTQELVLAWVGAPPADAKMAGLRFRRLGMIIRHPAFSHLTIKIRPNYKTDNVQSAVAQTITKTYQFPDTPDELVTRERWRFRDGAKVVSSLELTISDVNGNSTTDNESWSLKEIEFEVAARPRALGRPAPVPSGS